jgi:hypothetical protein
LVDDGGVVFQDEPVVRILLGGTLPCGWGALSEYNVTVLDLLKFRAKGADGLRYLYWVEAYEEAPHQYVVIRERIRARNGESIRGYEGDIEYTYYYDDARHDFDLINTSAPGMPDRLLATIESPTAFLALHTEAVCNRKHLATMQRRQKALREEYLQQLPATPARTDLPAESDVEAAAEPDQAPPPAEASTPEPSSD